MDPKKEKNNSCGESENSENNQKKRDHLFQPGQSGNPSGKPKGCKNHATRIAEKLIDGQAEEIIKKAIEMALGGDAQTMKAILDRLCPPRKDRPIKLELPSVTTPQDVLKAVAETVKSLGEGKIDPSQAQTIASILETQRRSIETVEIESRLQALEQLAKEKIK